MSELDQRVALMSKVHLFSGMKQEALARIGAACEELQLPAHRLVYARGDKPEGFYLILAGRVRVTRLQDKNEEGAAFLVKGDYFGEEALFERRNRSSNVTTSEETTLLFLGREAFEALLEVFPALKKSLEVAIKSHKLARTARFPWLGPKETIYFVARRHPIRLYQALVAPVLALAVPAGLIGWGLVVSAVTPLAVAGLVIVFIMGWIGWNWLDWSNDYYIITNQRVIWLEKVVGLYDSREEAPLSTILSVGVETDQLGRILDYGNVIVRTFVGRIEFDYVNHPQQAAEMVREYWERVKSVLTVSQKDVMRNTIRQKLGLPVERRVLDELPPIVNVDRRLANLPLWWVAFLNLFTLRTEEAGKVIYHKHWMVLLKQTWKPLALTLGMVGLQAWRLARLWASAEESLFFRNGEGALRPDTIAVALPILGVPFVLWLVWEYLDWKNDMYMVAADEIFDIDRKPLGREEKRSAQIDNILSTSYIRKGIIANMFNYGTVKISIGGGEFDFEDVSDPAGVQADINRRRAARIAKKNEDAGKEDRERFATWIAAYHENAGTFQINPTDLSPGDGKKPSGE